MNLRQSFNLTCALQLDRVKTFGYRRAVEFRPSLAGVPLPSQVASADVRSPEEERSGRQPNHGKSRDVRAGRMQLHRTNRNISRAQRRVLIDDCELTEEQRQRRRANERYRLKQLAKRMAKAQLAIVWPTEES